MLAFDGDDTLDNTCTPTSGFSGWISTWTEERSDIQGLLNVVMGFILT